MKITIETTNKNTGVYIERIFNVLWLCLVADKIRPNL